MHIWTGTGGVGVRVYGRCDQLEVFGGLSCYYESESDYLGYWAPVWMREHLE